MTGPINPDREQQRADNRASRRQSHIGPLPAELMEKDEIDEVDEKERNDGENDADAAEGSDPGTDAKTSPD